MGSVVTGRTVVYPWDCDHMGHANVTWYARRFDEATWVFLADAGLSPTYLRRERRGAVARDQQIAYLRELHAADLVRIRFAALRVGRSTLRFVHEMRDEESADLVATAVLTGVQIDATTRKACPLPDQVRDRTLAMLAPDQEHWIPPDPRGAAVTQATECRDRRGPADPHSSPINQPGVRS